jgi:poly(3-hydroxybutyrate) depolymerase
VPGVTTNDTQFTTDILNSVEKLYCLDPTRLTATGKSDGAGFTNVLACDTVLSSRFAAFAPVSGAYYVDTLPCSPFTVDIPCTPSRTNIPFLAFHGGNDTTIAFNGGERKKACLPAVTHFIQDWAQRDGLSETNDTIPVSSNTVLYQFGDASWDWLKHGLVGLVFDKVIGHDWPSTLPNSDNDVAGHSPASFNATPIILEFFANHPLPVTCL